MSTETAGKTGAVGDDKDGKDDLEKFPVITPDPKPTPLDPSGPPPEQPTPIGSGEPELPPPS